MFDDRTKTDQWFIEGTPVLDAAGDKVGTLSEYYPQSGYMVVTKGWLFHKDVYVPLDAIATGDDNGIYLKYTKDELNKQNFESPPDTSTMAPEAGTTAPMWNDTREAAAQGYYTDTGSTGMAAGSRTDTTGSMATDTRGAGDGDRASGDVTMPVYQEELVVGKRAEEQGRVHLHKDVVEEEQTVNVPLQRERVTVDRVPLSGDMSATAPEDAFTKRDIDVPVMGEEPVVNKQVRGVEEVRIHKDAVTDDQQVGDTVRKERVVTDGVDDTGQATTTTGMDRTSR